MAPTTVLWGFSAARLAWSFAPSPLPCLRARSPAQRAKLSRESQADVHLARGALGEGRKRNCIMRAVSPLALAHVVSDPNQGLC